MQRTGVWQTGTQTPAPAAFCSLAAGDVLNRDSLLSALAAALHFPTYFGHNWDAAWDCLNDLDWNSIPSGKLRLDIAPHSLVDEQSLAILIELIGEASEAWLAQEHDLTLLIVTDRDDLACIQALRRWPST